MVLKYHADLRRTDAGIPLTSTRRHLSAFASLALLGLLLPAAAAPTPANAAAIPAPATDVSPQALPNGFTDSALPWNVTDPTVVSFAHNGKIFIAQKDGTILKADSLTDTSLTQVADMTTDVYNYWDRGLLGMTVDPDFPTRPYLYVLYAYDHVLGQSGDVPHWDGGSSDGCPTPPGGNTDGCEISGRLDRLTIDTSDYTVSASKHLITDWCQQFPSHSVGSLAFGPDGALYASGGDGASFNEADYGQLGDYYGGDPCGDPSNEGGALRSQDLETGGDPANLDGSVIRIDPDTGAAWHTNANAGSADDNKARIIGYGLRNPFRMTVRSSGSVWLGDVGYNNWEEIDTIPNPDSAPRNFGWPCYEGSGAQNEYQSHDLSICQNIGSHVSPAFSYLHSDEVVSGDGCVSGSSAIAGIAFRGTGGNWPNAYDNALFFTDWARGCIWWAPNSGGQPDFGNVRKFADLDGGGGAVYLGFSPAGDLVYADLNRDEVHIIKYTSTQPPVAAFTASPTSGKPPLKVTFDASGSTSPGGGTLHYQWDLNGDGTYNDSTSRKPTKTYSSKGSYNVGLRVTAGGLSDTVHHVIAVGLTPPVAHIDNPVKTLKWAVGDDIGFSGHATDAQDGDLPDSAFTWTLKIEHCPSNCHEHTVQTWNDISTGDFFAPKHDYPSHVRLILKVTDSDGQSDTDSVDVYPRTGTVSAVSDPYGIPLTVGSKGIGMVGGSLEVAAPASAVLGEETLAFDSWSDGGGRGHAVDIGDGATHLIASYVEASSRDARNTCGGSALTPSGAWRPGRLASGSDVDWFKFTNTSSRTVQINLAELPGSASLKLYKGCSTLLATSDRPGDHPEEIIKVLPKGTYAIKITSKGTTSDATYKFRIRRLGTGLTVMSAKAIEDDGAGTLRLVGEVWNGYGSTRGPITVTAKLYDADGHLLATRHATALLSATSHSRAPFAIGGSLPDGFARAQYSASSVASKTSIRGVAVHATGFTEVDGRWQARGTLKATHGAVKSLKVMLTLYGDHGEVVDVVRGSVPRTTLATNHSTSYVAWSSITDLGIDRARIRALGIKP